jgi:hypothetical protein
MNPGKHLDFLLQQWPYDSDYQCVRLVKGCDGRDVIQIRLDLGILQLETSGRPDGWKPEGYETMLDLLADQEQVDPDFELDEDTCLEIDREFAQFYQRRVAWLRMQHFHRAIADADHTLALMDFCRDHSPDEQWTVCHEQHRAFVVFHRTQAAAMAAIEQENAEAAIEHVNEGLILMRECFEEMGWEDQFEEDELVCRLTELRDSLREEFAIGKSLSERLAEAVATEQYELAAQLRDELTRRSEN